MGLLHSLLTIQPGKEEQVMEKSTLQGSKTVKPAVGKTPPHRNPLLAHKFGADPYALVYEDRVYLYMTSDKLEWDENGQAKENSYGSIRKLTVISSADLANWTDHGEIAVAGTEGTAVWATQSWAPAIAHKRIDGRDQFFLYFANNGSGVGVLRGDSPLGPWTDPVGGPLIAAGTPGVEGVPWIFDPAVLVDDDGRGYLYFGGGVPEGQHEMPNSARVVRLGDDMVSLQGAAEIIPAPYMFEDSGIHKYGQIYYYTYCSNFYEGERAEGSPPPGEIACMTSTSPMGPWTYQGTFLHNPGHYFGVSGNNHHVIFPFRDRWYIAYHAQTLSAAMGVAHGYRSTHLDLLELHEEGSLPEAKATLEGVPQLFHHDPYAPTGGNTCAWSAGVHTDAEVADGEGTVSLLSDGAWLGLAGVDFGSSGPTRFLAVIDAAGVQGGALEVRLDHVEGAVLSAVTIEPGGGFHEEVVTCAEKAAAGAHDLYLIFHADRQEDQLALRSWRFER
ncbi:arabinoxylan arabinofuranohydrolase [Saccharibacillus sp. O16]|nr:arabinoxylan arabinofuranohydrolase [Saccharibacillus sp. O16]